MFLDTLPVEILTQIYLCLPTVDSVINLSTTCHRMRNTFQTSKRLNILQQAAEVEFGPIDEIVQLVTHNASQSAHIRRSVGLSQALLQQMLRVGRVAKRWTEIYPMRKWKDDFANRRLLTEAEAFLFRRALYRLWLFDRAYHNSAHPRTARLLPAIMYERTALLHNFNGEELAEMLDVHLVLRDVIANNICPSNGKMRARFHKRFQDHIPSQVSIHLNYARSSSALQDSCYNSKYHASLSSSLFPDVSLDGWGDDIMHYYVVEDMMKLDPEQILLLREQCFSKAQVESFITGLGEWFGNNGEVFSETLALVVKQRGGDPEELKDAVRDIEVGIVTELY
ncbi:hypothetical protein AMS68_004059 [Peltaster fructicola]|uniref:F-box domain-containing protein n=1 Tax=Peltaster fructicola TaxID=286661 RepID=A0A6H0XUW0_9PEZI|nr:hypothetical protein AMS68_004059 [Peltaster fructicola]